MIPVIEQNADPEAITGHGLKTLQPGEILRAKGSRRLNLNGEAFAHGVLDDHVNLHFVLIPVVVKTQQFVHSNRLLAQFVIDKGLQQ